MQITSDNLLDTQSLRLDIINERGNKLLRVEAAVCDTKEGCEARRQILEQRVEMVQSRF